jgi:hypothetical protein
MSVAKRIPVLLGVAALLGAMAAPASAAPAPAPAFSVSSVATPTNFNKAKVGNTYEVRLANVGGAVTDGSPIEIVDTLPKGLTVEKVEFKLRFKKGVVQDFGAEPTAGVCERQTVTEVTTVSCTVPNELPGSGEESARLFPAEELRLVIFVTLPGTVQEGDVLTNHATAEGGGAQVAAATSQNEVSAADAPVGFAEFNAELTGPDGQPVSQAGSHPYQMTTSFSLNMKRKSPGVEGPEFVPSGGDTKDIPVALPPGLIGNPTASDLCPLQQFNATHLVSPFVENPQVQLQQNDCPDSSAVGYVTIRRGDEAGTAAFPVYSLRPPVGMPAQFGFSLLGLPIFIDTELRPTENYRIVAAVHNISEAKRVPQAAVTLWGTPADPRHDSIRGHCLNSAVSFPNSLVPYIGNCPAGIAQKPSLRLPSFCGAPLDIVASVDTWTEPGSFVSMLSSSATPSGCNLLDFDPSLKARPTTSAADSPSGLDADVHIPQNEEAEALGEADLRDATITFPEGLVLNPSGANGLGACSAAQIGLQASSPSGFDDQAAQCPDNAKIGTVEVDTPLLDEPLHGSLFTAMPFENPFDSLLAVYIAVNDPVRGIVVKLAGHVVPDPNTGRLSTTFAENPQTPFEDFKVHLFEGARAALRTPAVCGAYSSTSTMMPWSAPESGPPATPSDTYAIDRSPSGSSCPASAGALPNSPSFDAGTVAPIAGAFSPLVLHLRRDDDSQEFASLTVTPPPGLLARLAGVPYCSDSALASAAARPGKAEQASPSCPAASQVGTVEVGAGAGPDPFYAQGKAYLAGPYKGAPLSFAVVTPATAGPYDVGTVVVRIPLHIDPETLRVEAVSDPFPHILQGIPLDVRSIDVKIDRPNFMINPTNCDPLSLSGSLLTTLGQTASLQNRFQVGECGRLAFKPRLKLRLKGGTRRAANPKLIATIQAGEGEAGFARASVKLPRSAFLDQSHIRTVCTRVQFAVDACPPGSIYGTASARSPLLDYPVSGNVYLRSSSHKLPDLVIDLRGPDYQPVRADLVGRTDSVKGALRNTFDFLPDVPVSEFHLELFGGKRGLVINSRNLCAHPYRAEVKLQSQSGKAFDTRPLVQNDCPSKRKKQHRRRGGGPSS